MNRFRVRCLLLMLGAAFTLSSTALAQELPPSVAEKIQAAQKQI